MSRTEIKAAYDNKEISKNNAAKLLAKWNGNPITANMQIVKGW